MVYTDFVSTLIQRVKVRALLPVTEKDVLKALNEMNGGGSEVHPMHPDAEYIIEPAPFAVFEKMIPQLVAMELYHAILESNASQEAARMMAMKSATDAARDMANDLTLAMNQIRQQKITQEIAELSAGMAAVSK
jgi:F-type H+-transporting ATPase subunit gamma